MIEILVVVIIIMVIVMILIINTNSNSDFDQLSLNCYFLKKFCLIEFFFQFYYLIYNLFGIDLHDFSKLSVSGLMIRVTNLKNYYIF